MNRVAEVIGIAFIYVFITIINIILLRDNQKKIGFVHPGWFLVIVNGLYGFIVPISYIVLREDIHKAYSGVYKYFNYDNFVFIMWMYVFVSIGFLYSETIIILIRKISLKKVKNNYMKFRKKKEEKVDLKSIYLVLNIMLIIGIYLIYLRFNIVGGLSQALLYNRRDLAAEFAESGIFSRYDYFFNIYFIIKLSVILKYDRKKRKIFRYVLILFGYILFTFVMGIRLNILVLLLSLFSVLYSNDIKIYKKGGITRVVSQFWLKNKRKLVFGVVLVFILFSWYTFQRTNIRNALVGGALEIKNVSLVSMLFPGEFGTGYVPGLISLNNNYNSLGSSYWLKFIPGRVKSFIGMDMSNTVAKDLAWNLHGKGRAAVYTITLPIDIYVATNNVFMIIVISSILYFIFWTISNSIHNKTIWSTSLNSIIILNIYYVIRVEASNWFPRFWQSISIFLITMLVYQFVSKVKIKRIKR